MKVINIYFFIAAVSILINVSCEKETIYSDGGATLEFSADTVLFDTVFSTFGSATKKLKIYNSYNQPIIVTSLKIAGGTASPYKINVDGRVGPEINNLRIEANDSTYVFVQVFIDPTNQNLPVLVEDSLECVLNGNYQNIKLLSYGQDVHLIHDSSMTTQTWIADKPYVVDSMLIDSNAVLTIAAGVTIYMRRNGFIWVDGRLIVNGTREKPVVIRGTRLDKSNYAPPVLYDRIPGQWSQIRFSNSSTGNKINYADIRNAQFGVVAGLLNTSGLAEVELSNCRIYNHSAVAVFGINSKVKAWNCILSNCGWSAFMCVQGGEYEFYHCTLASYPSFGQTTGYAAYILNYATEPDTGSSDPYAKKYYYGDLKKAFFGNCILFGELEEEVILSKLKDYAFEYTFDHSLLKGTTRKLNIADETRFITTKISDKAEPGFKKVDKVNYVYDFMLTRTSMARDIGSVDIANLYSKDYNGNSRTSDESPDAGAYEYIPGSE
jgi:hypothetical protein